MDVSIIIINYNTPELTIDCIKSIIKLTKEVSYELILVDNNSSDNSVVRFKEEFGFLEIISLDKNIGFGRANNLGSKRAQGKYLFFLNSDTILLNNALLVFHEFMERNVKQKDIGAVGTILLDSEKTPTHSSGFFPVMWSRINFLLNKNNQRERLVFGDSHFFQVDYITGAALFVLREVFESYNGFDADFFMYYEETEFQKRLNKDGKRCLLIKGPEIIHLEGMSTNNKKMSNAKTIMKLNGMFLYHKKHTNRIVYFIFRVFYFVFRFPIIFRKSSSRLEKISFLKILLYNPILNK